MNTNDIVELYKDIIRDKNKQIEEIINARDQFINAKDQLIMAKDDIIKTKDQLIEIQKKDFTKYLNSSNYLYIKI
jgi:hypothetical protein